MADVIGTVASVLQLAEITAKTALKVYDFFSIIQNAPHEITALGNDVLAISVLVRNLANSLASKSVEKAIQRDAEIEDALQSLIDPMNNCQAAVKRLQDKIKPHLTADLSSLQGTECEIDSSQSNTWKMKSKNVRWFLQRKDVYASAAELERAKLTFGGAMASITFSILTLKQSNTNHQADLTGFQKREYDGDAVSLPDHGQGDCQPGSTQTNNVNIT
ncbi:hypothetical protein N7495_000339 [Penicillium taxi]|uniref:uncharacterized protein n=1 Tax=Penicillium taxi TaxID=168475 RepID=UPI0025451D53|nr:uncharacterized protein N7495_000339 [Penicillium taxi]KAJ5907657.1 hypothetical protein N7495_000339 [Penicillium taxi]